MISLKQTKKYLKTNKHNSCERSRKRFYSRLQVNFIILVVQVSYLTNTPHSQLTFKYGYLTI